MLHYQLELDTIRDDLPEVFEFIKQNKIVFASFSPPATKYDVNDRIKHLIPVENSFLIELGLMHNERLAILLHEIGHIKENTYEKKIPEIDKEYLADNFVASLGTVYKNALIMVLDKMIKNKKCYSIEELEKRKENLNNCK